jgi:hypothetical protein
LETKSRRKKRRRRTRRRKRRRRRLSRFQGTVTSPRRRRKIF